MLATTAPSRSNSYLIVISSLPGGSPDVYGSFGWLGGTKNPSRTRGIGAGARASGARPRLTNKYEVAASEQHPGRHGPTSVGTEALLSTRGRAGRPAPGWRDSSPP